MTVMYGISNCDTVKKARAWLGERGIDYTFHDFRKDGVNPVWLRAWVDEFGWETLVNRKGTTWRKLPEETRDNMDEAIAHARMKAGLLVTTSVNKIKILEQTQDEEKGTFRIAFAYAATGKATGGYIEVRPVPKHQQSSATGLQESYAGVALE